MLSPSLSAPPASGDANNIDGWLLEPEVAIDDYLGVKFYVNTVGAVGVPNHHCTISVYEWRDNVSYPLREYRFRDACLTSDGQLIIDSGMQYLEECYLTTKPSGEFYFITRLTRDRGYNVAPQTGSYVGGYGTYKLEAHCGVTDELQYEGNFTVIRMKEPTFIMDYMDFVVQNPMYISIALFALIFGAVFIYWLLKMLGLVD